MNPKTCDLCKEPCTREFEIRSKHLDSWGCKKFTFKKTNKSKWIVKHICEDCYARLFPEDILEVKYD